MRIHSNTLTSRDVYAAAREARATVEVLTEHGSRSRDHAFEVKLSGESRRRPNGGNYGAERDVFAATWDQWGVFLQILFDADTDLTIPRAYADRDEYIRHTNARFTKIGGGWTDHWPADAHGDHTFRYAGIPRTHACTKCSAVQRWS